MKRRLLIAGFLACLHSTFAIDISLQPTRKLWVLDGFAQAIKESEGTVYIGGKFFRAGRWTGSASLINGATGDVTPGFPTVNGIIGASADDGAGGFFIIGSFSEVAGTPRSYIAHFRADGSFDSSWSANVGPIRGISVANGRIYFFGNSEKEANQTITKIRALQLSDGAALPLSFTIKGTVNQILATSDRIFVAGEFTQATTSQSWDVAAYDLSGQLTSWNPRVNGEITQMALGGNTLYIAGYFTSVDGKLQSGLAAINATTGSSLNWAPVQNVGGIYALKVFEDTLYVGGSFNTISNQPRNNLALFSVATGELLPFAPTEMVQLIRSIGIGPDYIAVGGDVGLGFKPGDKMFVLLDRATGQARPTTVKPNMAILVTIPLGESCFIGGAFSMLSGEERIGAAAFDAETGELTPWNPHPETNVLALAVLPDKVIIAGELNSVGGQPRKHIAAVDRITGALIENWRADPDFGIIDMAPYQDRLYVGGVFRNISGQVRTNIAALDLQTGAVLPFDPQLNRGSVRAIKISGNTMYIGGLISKVGSVARTRIAAFDLTTETLTDWAPTLTGTANIEDIEINNDIVYAVGRFSSINGQPRTNAAAISITGEVLPWAPNPTGNTVDVAIYGDKIFLTGEFQNVAGQPRTVLAATDLQGNVLPWAPNPEFLGYALEVANNQLYFGGAFISLSSEARFGFAGFTLAEIPIEAPIIDPTTFKLNRSTGTVEFNITATGQTITPQYSENLKDWFDLPAITINGPATIQDANVGSRATTFYRLKF